MISTPCIRICSHTGPASDRTNSGRSARKKVVTFGLRRSALVEHGGNHAPSIPVQATRIASNARSFAPTLLTSMIHSRPNHSHSGRRPYLRSTLIAIATCTALARPAVGQTPPIVPCSGRVYTNDPDPKGTNIRNAPGTKGAVLKTLTDDDTQLEITGSSGDWLRIKQALRADGTLSFAGEGWVFAPLMAIRARGAATLRASDSEQSAPAGSMKHDQQAAGVRLQRRVAACEIPRRKRVAETRVAVRQPGNYMRLTYILPCMARRAVLVLIAIVLASPAARCAANCAERCDDQACATIAKGRSGHA